MLDGNKIDDIREISRYGKAKGFLVAKKYNLPTYSNFFIVKNEEDVKLLLERFKGQNDFCMRSDTLVGNISIGIGGQNGSRESIFEYIRNIKRREKELGVLGVAIIYWNDGKFCPSYETEGSFYLDYRTNKELLIDYVGKGWDGSFLSHGSACHETYSIPWEDILFFDDNNRGKYRKQIISEYAYSELRKARIKDLNEKYGLPLDKCESIIPSKYGGIKNEYFRQVINQVILPMYDSKDLQEYYREYIPIAQIENGKVLVPEVILPERLRIKVKGGNIEER